MMNTKSVALLMVVMMVTMGMENILVQAHRHHHHHHHSPSPSPSPSTDSDSLSSSLDFDLSSLLDFDLSSKSPSHSPKSKGKLSSYCMIGCSFEKCFHHGKSSTMRTGHEEKFESCIKKCSKICNKKKESDDIYV
ncbi:hypothetical protein ISN45_Aa02g001960 [Arabidopsis thaliana x Arabidopsis arenosa]|uniref:Transmembrane protein n=1 Tax=Arabidopsis thaliana x Arabidopsis arenosa TaxID=1240361 RepID=A0A8T2BFM8_9BRAS|nr:hypothetical protein ISN45_Aa02g001960 [Arabidopsis thaliana x Arabidopsis arenosa]